jgi:hypothetical protein
LAALIEFKLMSLQLHLLGTMKEPTPCPKGKTTTTTTPKKKHKDGGKKAPGPTQCKKSVITKISNTELTNTPNARIGTPPNARTGSLSTNTGTRPNRHAFKTFQGTVDDEKRMLQQSIKAII